MTGKLVKVTCLFAMLVLGAPVSGSWDDKWDKACKGPTQFEEDKNFPMQGLMDEESKAQWWWTGQGSQIMPYEWFLHLKQAENPRCDNCENKTSNLFRDKDNMQRFRFVFAAQTSDVMREANPDNLPKIGRAHV